jgi:hypothetical protein
MADYRGPAGNKRATGAGPMVYDSEMPPEFPDNFTPPKVTDSYGRENYWTNWTNPDRNDIPLSDVPSSLRGVTGAYIPEKDWVVVDDRIERHHTVQLDISIEPDSSIPSFKEYEIVPFATDYIGPDGENVIGLQGLVDSMEEIEYWESYVSIPESGSLLIHDERDVHTTTPSSEDVYKIVYPMKVLGLEQYALADIEHTYRRLANAERRVYMSELYREMTFENVLPETKFERNNMVSRPER